MKIQLASDIHFETHADEGKAFLAQFQNAGADVLVLAGDICPTRLTARLATVIADAASKWMIGTTRVVCNPRGYPREKSIPLFKNDLVIELPQKP